MLDTLVFVSGPVGSLKYEMPLLIACHRDSIAFWKSNVRAALGDCQDPTKDTASCLFEEVVSLSRVGVDVRVADKFCSGQDFVVFVENLKLKTLEPIKPTRLLR